MKARSIIRRMKVGHTPFFKIRKSPLRVLSSSATCLFNPAFRIGLFSPRERLFSPSFPTLYYVGIFLLLVQFQSRDVLNIKHLLPSRTNMLFRSQDGHIPKKGKAHCNGNS